MRFQATNDIEQQILPACYVPSKLMELHDAGSYSARNTLDGNCSTCTGESNDLGKMRSLVHSQGLVELVPRLKDCIQLLDALRLGSSAAVHGEIPSLVRHGSCLHRHLSGVISIATVRGTGSAPCSLPCMDATGSVGTAWTNRYKQHTLQPKRLDGVLQLLLSALCDLLLKCKGFVLHDAITAADQHHHHHEHKEQRHAAARLNS